MCRKREHWYHLFVLLASNANNTAWENFTFWVQKSLLNFFFGKSLQPLTKAYQCLPCILLGSFFILKKVSIGRIGTWAELSEQKYRQFIGKIRVNMWGRFQFRHSFQQRQTFKTIKENRSPNTKISVPCSKGKVKFELHYLVLQLVRSN